MMMMMIWWWPWCLWWRRQTNHLAWLAPDRLRMISKALSPNLTSHEMGITNWNINHHPRESNMETSANYHWKPRFLNESFLEDNFSHWIPLLYPKSYPGPQYIIWFLEAVLALSYCMGDKINLWLRLPWGTGQDPVSQNELQCSAKIGLSQY